MAVRSVKPFDIVTNGHERSFWPLQLAMMGAMRGLYESRRNREMAANQEGISSKDRRVSESSDSIVFRCNLSGSFVQGSAQMYSRYLMERHGRKSAEFRNDSGFILVAPMAGLIMEGRLA